MKTISDLLVLLLERVSAIGATTAATRPDLLMPNFAIAFQSLAMGLDRVDLPEDGTRLALVTYAIGTESSVSVSQLRISMASDVAFDRMATDIYKPTVFVISRHVGHLADIIIHHPGRACREDSVDS
jgi:hypothetical protein